MVWKIDEEGPLRGQNTVRVVNRRGETGEARVEYYPACQVVGPVVEVVETDPEGFPLAEAEVIDRRPTFRS